MIGKYVNLCRRSCPRNSLPGFIPCWAGFVQFKVSPANNAKFPVRLDWLRLNLWRLKITTIRPDILSTIFSPCGSLALSPDWSTLIGRGMSRLGSHSSRASLVMLAPAVLCHKEQAWASKAPYCKWLSCTERSNYRRPYAIKNQQAK